MLKVYILINQGLSVPRNLLKMKENALQWLSLVLERLYDVRASHNIQMAETDKLNGTATTCGSPFVLTTEVA